MQMRRGLRRAWLVAALAVVVGQPVTSRAFSTGVPSTVFGASGCPLCHSGGSPPTVVLSGPTVLSPGDTADYTLTIFGSPAQPYGGLNVSSNGGLLSGGGPFALGTQVLSGTGGLAEITHTTPKQGDVGNVVEFSFRWTAPPAFSGTVTLSGWGNAVNRNFASSGDAAALATLEIVSTAPSPTPTATPTPAPDLCGDVAPLDPALVTDAAAQSCQKAVTKVGTLYVKKGLKAVQKCLKSFHKAGAPAADPLALCAGSAAASIPPTDAKAAASLTKAAAKLRAILAAKCDDAAVAVLGLCAATETGLEDCLLTAHHQGITETVVTQYGALQPTADPSARKCQAIVGKTAAGLLNTYLKASGKCLTARNKDGSVAAGAPLCIGTVSGGFVPPTDAKVAAALVKATAKLSSKVSASCTEGNVGDLDACAGNKADLIQCLVCAQRSIAFDLLGSQFGGN
jgi:hypothetical protein